LSINHSLINFKLKLANYYASFFIKEQNLQMPSYFNKIYNISSQYHFLESLRSWLRDNFEINNNLNLILPSKRSSANFKKLLIKNDYVLPKINAISDICLNDFSIFKDLPKYQEICNEIANAKKLDQVQAMFMVGEEIAKVNFFGKLSFEHSCKLALKFQEIFDDIEFEEINITNIKNIENINLALHQQLSLDFIKDFYLEIKKKMLQNNLYFASSYQNFITNKYCFFLNQLQLNYPIIIAGSTGSINSSKNLIKAIANQNNGYVVLHNFYEINQLNKNHPQFLNNQLLNHLQINEKLIKNIEYQELMLSSNNRYTFLQETMKTVDESDSWQKLKKHPNINKIIDDLKENFLYYEALNPIHEAKIIVRIIEDNLHKNYKIGIIDNNPIVSRNIENLLNINGVEYFNSSSASLNNNDLIIFLSDLILIKETDFNSALFLNILRNKFCKFAGDFKLLNLFEIEVIRQERELLGLKGILKKCQTQPILENFIEEFLDCLPKDKSIVSLILCLEKISGKKFNEIAIENRAGKEIFEFFNKLIHYNYNYNNASEFSFVCSAIKYQNSIRNNDWKIQILSNIEARLINFDLIIIPSLNYGDFPEITEDNWLGNKILFDLGIDRSTKKISQNAFDFFNYLGNKKIILTRSISSANSLNISSPFLLKILTLLKKINNTFELKKIIEVEQINFAPFKISNPIYQPDPKFLPKKLTITEFSTLINEPYSIYLKKILRLNELKKIDYQPSYSEFGSFTHKALEKYISGENFDDFKKIFYEYFINKEAIYTWYVRFNKIFENFLNHNSEIDQLKNYCEYKINFNFQNLNITGKIDRIIIDNNNKLSIIDYKTGLMPSSKSVISCTEPQLTLSAIGLIEQGFCLVSQINNLFYWKLSINNSFELRSITTTESKLEQLIIDTYKNIQEIIDKYFVNNSPFYATNESKNYFYNNLMRYEEWSK